MAINFKFKPGLSTIYQTKMESTGGQSAQKVSNHEYIVRKYTGYYVYYKYWNGSQWISSSSEIDIGDILRFTPSSEEDGIWGHDPVTLTKNGLVPNSSTSITLYTGWGTYYDTISVNSQGVATFSCYILPGTYTYYFGSSIVQTLEIMGNIGEALPRHSGGEVYLDMVRQLGNVDSYNFYYENILIAEKNVDAINFILSDLNRDYTEFEIVPKDKYGNEHIDKKSTVPITLNLAVPKVSVKQLSTTKVEISWNAHEYAEFLVIYIDKVEHSQQDASQNGSITINLEADKTYLFQFQYTV